MYERAETLYERAEVVAGNMRHFGEVNMKLLFLFVYLALECLNIYYSIIHEHIVLNGKNVNIVYMVTKYVVKTRWNFT